MRVSFNLPDYEHGEEHAWGIVSWGGTEVGIERTNQAR